MLQRLTFSVTLSLITLSLCAAADPVHTAPPPPATERAPQIHIIDDPLEPLNRAFYSFNNGFTYVIVHPFEKGYTFVVPEPGRKSLQKFGYNLIYPNRLVNTLLQGKFKGAGVETERFLVNTTVGLLGFFDPATKMGLGNYDEDFGHTFAHYGAGFGFYFVIPIFGPSSFRDGVGKLFDDVFNPTSWVDADFFFMLNDLSFTLPDLERLNTMELDPYATTRELWALARKRKVLDYDEVTSKGLPAPAEINPVETLDAVFLRPTNPKFFQRSKTRSVEVPSTRRKLPYSVWMQDKPAPLVFIVEGIGVHRLADSTAALAEMVYKQGLSAVTISNPFNWEFIAKAGSRAVPGLTPVDAGDLNGACQAVYADLAARYPSRITGKALLGTSLGGLDALFIADQEARQPGGFQFDRIVAVNPPVDLIHAVTMVDEYAREPLRWPEPERRAHMESVLLRAIALREIPYQPGAKLPFTEAESKFIIGYYYHTILTSIIFASQKKENLGIIPVKLGKWERQPAYDAIARFDYTDYVRQFVLPYYMRGEARTTQLDLIRRVSMRSLGPTLAVNPKVRLFTNSDDFLLTPEDIAWLKATFGDRMTLFENGGHLGNLHLPEVQARVVKALEGMK